MLPVFAKANGEIISSTLTSAVNMLRPEPETMHLADIAHNLSNLVRFNGGMSHRYTVAEHSIAVVDIMRQSAAETGEVLRAEAYAYALLHDAHEAYIGDITSPTKAALKHLAGHDVVGFLADRFDRAIFEAAGLEPAMPLSIKARISAADTVAVNTEHDLFRMGPTRAEAMSFQCAFERFISDARHYNIRSF